MNKIVFLIFSFCFSIILSAKEVSREMASSVAIEYLVQNTGVVRGIKSISVTNYNESAAYYIVSFEPEGWALIAADDMAKPLMAYSLTGKFQLTEQPASMKSWLNSYSEEIHSASKIQGKLPQGGWTKSTASKIKSSTSVSKIDPLVQVMWNQSKPFNTYCPTDADGTAYVGCVAVAMAQAVSVAKYPARPTGSFSYFCSPYGTLSINYDNEPTYDWDAIISGSDSKDGAARLLYQCGVSVKMDYSSTGSGTQTSYVPNALKKYFSYPASVEYYERSSYEGDWETLILNELSSGRAVVYSGYDGVSSAGHAFNLDGYDGNNMYHVNWGWGGQNNGFYTIDALRDGDQDYTKQQAVVVGIRAPSQAPMDIKLSSLTITENQPIGSVVGDVVVESEATSPVYTYELKGKYSVITHGYKAAAFYIEDNVLKTKSVFSFANGDQTVFIKATNNENGLSIEREFSIKVAENSTALTRIPILDVLVSVDKQNIIVSSDKVCTYSLYSLTGSKIKTGITREPITEISTTDIQSGCYIIRLNNPNGVFSQKVIIN